MPVFKELEQFPLTIYFLWCMLTIVSTLMLFQIFLVSSFYILMLFRILFGNVTTIYFALSETQSQGSPNIYSLIRLFFLQFWAYISILLIGELGERLINRFEDIDICSVCDWYLFPANVQRIIPMILMNTQLTVALAGYGNIE